MDDEPTCGKGLAEHSALPAKLGELTAAMADLLEFHQTTLDLTDENAKKERAAYVELGKAFRGIAAELHATARQMAGYRDLPMGRHDYEALGGPEAVSVFATFVEREQELADLLKPALERDQQMLAQMRGAQK